MSAAAESGLPNEREPFFPLYAPFISKIKYLTGFAKMNLPSFCLNFSHLMDFCPNFSHLTNGNLDVWKANNFHVSRKMVPEPEVWIFVHLVKLSIMRNIKYGAVILLLSSRVVVGWMKWIKTIMEGVGGLDFAWLWFTFIHSPHTGYC